MDRSGPARRVAHGFAPAKPTALVYLEDVHFVAAAAALVLVAVLAAWLGLGLGLGRG